MRLSRRNFLAQSALLFSAAAYRPSLMLAQSGLPLPKPTFHFFTKPFVGLSYQEIAKQVAAIGYDGVEVPIRKKEIREGADVVDEIPKMVEAYRNEKLEVVTLTTDIVEVSREARTEEILRTAQKCGVKRFRMGWYRYDNTKPIWPQLDSFRSKFHDLIALAKEIGIQPTYQNHSGAKMAGAGIWDAALLMKDYPLSDVAWAFDMMHAKVEGGLSWPTQFALARDRLAVVQFKNYVWENNTPRPVSLATGIVNKESVDVLKKINYAGPCLIHIEYLKGDIIQPDFLASVIKASKDDLITLQSWWKTF
jgi:sugar phosphate isomerase/epimerase